MGDRQEYKERIRMRKTPILIMMALMLVAVIVPTPVAALDDSYSGIIMEVPVEDADDDGSNDTKYSIGGGDSEMKGMTPRTWERTDPDLAANMWMEFDTEDGQTTFRETNLRKYSHEVSGCGALMTDAEISDNKERIQEAGEVEIVVEGSGTDIITFMDIPGTVTEVKKDGEVQTIDDDYVIESDGDVRVVTSLSSHTFLLSFDTSTVDALSTGLVLVGISLAALIATFQRKKNEMIE